MAHIRKSNRHGTADDAAKHASGFSANGESVFTRRSARADASARFNRAPLQWHGRRSLAELIAESERKVEWLEAELAIEDSPRRKAKLAQDLQIRGRFLTKLIVERDGQ